MEHIHTADYKPYQKVMDEVKELTALLDASEIVYKKLLSLKDGDSSLMKIVRNISTTGATAKEVISFHPTNELLGVRDALRAEDWDAFVV